MKRWNMLLVGLIMILAMALVACGGGGEVNGGNGGAADPAEESEVVSSGDPAAGEELYDQVCIACHGPGGEGIEGLGKPFTTSEFVASHSDQELLEFVKQGRPIDNPENTTGVDMPPKGGNPALTDEQILDVIAFIRTLNEQ